MLNIFTAQSASYWNWIMKTKPSIACCSILVVLALTGCEPLRSVPDSIPLFNGMDLTGWHIDAPARDNDPTAPAPFIVRDGMLVSLGTPRGHLITDAVHSNYRLDVQYRFPGQPGNCGVLVHASTPRALSKMFPKSIEVQMNHQHAGDFWCIVRTSPCPTW